MAAYHTYLRRIYDLIETVVADEGVAIETAAEWMATSLAHGGVIHFFGSGHSHMIAEEVFHRAGSMLPLNPLLDANLTFLGHLNATLLERTSGYGAVIINSQDIRSGEVVFVISNSGVNPVPVEAALAAKKRGAKTIAISSVENYVDVPARMESGQKLSDVVDLSIDTHVPHGDALVRLPGVETSVGGASSVIGMAIINAIVVEAAAIMVRDGHVPPIIPSMNVPDGDQRMEELIQQYGSRLPLLRNA
ncbi:MAG TPA: SIS domain-containing protein [Thermomicrobiales bacterium]|nr:SIS domain-containing protein [Thermomicrobiales bacterium]